jgi:hypothetical protein
VGVESQPGRIGAAVRHVRRAAFAPLALLIPFLALL